MLRRAKHALATALSGVSLIIAVAALVAWSASHSRAWQATYSAPTWHVQYAISAGELGLSCTRPNPWPTGWRPISTANPASLSAAMVHQAAGFGYTRWTVESRRGVLSHTAVTVPLWFIALLAAIAPAAHVRSRLAAVAAT